MRDLVGSLDLLDYVWERKGREEERKNERWEIGRDGFFLIIVEMV